MDNNSIISTLLAGMEKHKFLYLDYGRYGLMVEPSKEKEDIDNINRDIYFFVSVPSSSDLKNEDGEEMAADLLAKTYAKAVRSLFTEDLYRLNKVSEINLYAGAIEESVKKHIKIKYKIRNEHWTREKEEKATATIMAVLMDRKNKV